MDITSAPGGFLSAYVLVGILLPIAASFILDGIVHVVVGKGVRTIVLASVVTAAIVSLFGLAWQNGVAAADQSIYGAGTFDSMNGAIELLLPFSIAGALIGFAIRMLDLFLNPRHRAARHAAVKERESRALRVRLARAAPPRQTT